MRYGTSMVLLVLATVLESGGDAPYVVGYPPPDDDTAFSISLTPAAWVLAAYGYIVNAPPWQFGSLLGVYVTIFFLVAQSIAWLAFAENPSSSVILGGTLIIVGGLIVSVGK
jgi:hypothetical protein